MAYIPPSDANLKLELGTEELRKTWLETFYTSRWAAALARAVYAVRRDEASRYRLVRAISLRETAAAHLYSLGVDVY